MSKLVIDQSKITITIVNELIKVCPFNAFDYNNGVLEINASCKMCKLCVKKGPAGIVTFVSSLETKVNKDEWRGIAVYVEMEHECVHPVSFELIGKAKELASEINHPVYAVMVASRAQVEKCADLILSYGCDELFIYQDEKYADFNVELHASCVCDFINKYKPTVVLYGGTPLGRSFAPRIAAHFRTGLTADCTKLGIKENTDLIQVRPAFGGNIMAQIICTNNRPQMATVRYKIFKMPERQKPTGKKVFMSLEGLSFLSTIKLLNIQPKEKVVDISEAEVIIALGRPFKNDEDFAMAQELADLLGGIIACTRPLVENGLRDPKAQIGLSGKTVAPKLMITLGVSGAVQFTAGMSQSELVISVNSNPNAPIFDISHYGIVDDVFKVIPQLIAAIKKELGK